MRTVATIEARMTSSRLPGKVLMSASEKPMLLHLVDRLKSVPSLDDIVIATTINQADNAIVDFAIEHSINYYRGSENDVMSRVIESAEKYKAEVIVEITGDCPIIDPQIVEQTIQMFKVHNADYVSNAHIRGYPIGMDAQVFLTETLKKSAAMTKNLLDREHVTLHIRNNPKIFSHIHLFPPPELYWPELGLTLDELSDFELLKIIIEHFYEDNPLFSCLDVVKFLKSRPDLLNLNNFVIRKGDN
uniref:cytidylyltransferase domain-containing protein n=1 Tax=Algoriphagus sp. TaxID=1872435 RepID=UPI0040470FD6